MKGLRQVGRGGTFVFAAIVSAISCWPAHVSLAAEEWPTWRGPRGDGIVREEGLLDRWPNGGPRKVWSRPVGIGFSSPIGFEGRVYLFSLEGDKETLVALDAETGKPAWTQGYEIGNSPDYAGTRATPTIEGNRIYTYGSTGMLVARNLPDGKELWRLDVLKASGRHRAGGGRRRARRSSTTSSTCKAATAGRSRWRWTRTAARSRGSHRRRTSAGSGRRPSRRCRASGSSSSSAARSSTAWTRRPAGRSGMIRGKPATT